jgi:hypothetical protein
MRVETEVRKRVSICTKEKTMSGKGSRGGMNEVMRWIDRGKVGREGERNGWIDRWK